MLSTSMVSNSSRVGVSEVSSSGTPKRGKNGWHPSCAGEAERDSRRNGRSVVGTRVRHRRSSPFTSGRVYGAADNFVQGFQRMDS
jgi:hypothetical protein